MWASVKCKYFLRADTIVGPAAEHLPCSSGNSSAQRWHFQWLLPWLQVARSCATLDMLSPARRVRSEPLSISRKPDGAKKHPGDAPNPCDGLATPAMCPAIADHGVTAFGLGERRIQDRLPHACSRSCPFGQVNYFELNPMETSQAQEKL